MLGSSRLGLGGGVLQKIRYLAKLERRVHEFLVKDLGQGGEFRFPNPFVLVLQS
jgi:hypothetical protein